MSDADLHRNAERLVARALRRGGFRVEAAPHGAGAQFLVSGGSGRQAGITVLVRAGPHRRGGGANLGMHWMLGRSPAQYVALVDASRRRAWLLPAREFRRFARPLRDGRAHLDWIVARLGPTRTTIADEAAFDRWLLPGALLQLQTALPH